MKTINDFESPELRAVYNLFREQEGIKKVNFTAAKFLVSWGCPTSWVIAAAALPLAKQEPKIIRAVEKNLDPASARLLNDYCNLDRTVIQNYPGKAFSTIQYAYNTLRELFIASYINEPLAFIAIATMLSEVQQLKENQAVPHQKIQWLEIVLLPLLERYGMWKIKRRVSEALFIFATEKRMRELN